ncbi:MAG: DUF6502 family protein [Rhodoferax sp.]|nr:DUF6502 family protein [Rhodoferax sp.]
MTSNPSNNEPPLLASGPAKSSLATQAIAELLKPLARLMIEHSVQLMPMMELMKKALVEEAQASFGLADKGNTDTRVALLTGVHRKDVRRLREAPDVSAEALPMVPVAAAVVARWISEPRYLNADQSTRALARTPRRSAAGQSDFSTLVAEVSRDVGARAVLDELLRLGVVTERDDGLIELKSAAFVPKEGLSESYHFLAANVSDHLACAVHNLMPDRRTPAMLEQSAFCQDLSAEQAEQLQLRARQLWAASLQQFLPTATVAKQRSQGQDGPRHRVRFGVYFYDDLHPPEEQAAIRPKAPRPPHKKPKS